MASATLDKLTDVHLPEVLDNLHVLKPPRPLRDMTVSHFSRLLPDMTLKEANRLLEERYPKLGARPLMYQHHPMFPLTANRYMPHIIALPDDIFLRDKLDNSKLRICDVVATLLYQLDCQNPNILDCFYGSIQDKECGMVQGLGATLKRKEVGGRKPPHLLIHRNKNQVLVGVYEHIIAVPLKQEHGKQAEGQLDIHWHGVCIFHVHSNGYWSHVSAAHNATQPEPLSRIWTHAPSGNVSGAWNLAEQSVEAIEEGCRAKDNALAAYIWRYQPWYVEPGCTKTVRTWDGSQVQDRKVLGPRVTREPVGYSLDLVKDPREKKAIRTTQRSTPEWTTNRHSPLTQDQPYSSKKRSSPFRTSSPSKKFSPQQTLGFFENPNLRTGLRLTPSSPDSSIPGKLGSDTPTEADDVKPVRTPIKKYDDEEESRRELEDFIASEHEAA